MARVEIKLPAMGEGIIEASITRWFAAEGDFISEDQSLVEVATDKVDSEIPSPVSGILQRIVYKEGEIPKVGEVIALIETDKEKAGTKSPDLTEKPGTEPDTDNNYNDDIPGKTTGEIYFSDTPPVSEKKQVSADIFLSPFIKNLAKQRGIDVNELEQIKGTGNDNRITKDDLNNYIRSGRPYRYKMKKESFEDTLNIKPEKTLELINDLDEVIEMDRVRKLIADNMLKSKKTAPHVTSFIEADVTELVTWRENIKKQFIEHVGVNLTYTAIITSVVAKTLKEFPRINSSVDGDKILIKKEINVGIATALTNGNLIVAVIKQADKENLRGLALKISDLTQRARENKLQPTEIKGSTFTITNIGQYNSLTGTPIINLPEVAILAVGTIKKKPAVVKYQGESGIGIRDIVVLSLTYDHRIIDGALGGGFLNKIAWQLENFDTSQRF